MQKKKLRSAHHKPGRDHQKKENKPGKQRLLLGMLLAYHKDDWNPKHF